MLLTPDLLFSANVTTSGKGWMQRCRVVSPHSSLILFRS